MPRKQKADRGQPKDLVAYKLGKDMMICSELNSKLRTNCVASLWVLLADNIECWAQTSDKLLQIQIPALPICSVISGKWLNLSEPYFPYV